MKEKLYKTDVVVVGGGLSGLVTALELISLNKKVIILDRDTPENKGGLARKAFGGMFFVNTPEQRLGGIKDSVDLALKDWYSFGEFTDTTNLRAQWASKYVNLCTDFVYRWLKHHDVGFFPIVHWVERGLYKQGNSVPRFHMVWGTGDGLAKAIIMHIEKHRNANQSEMKYRHYVKDIVLENGVIKGVSGIDEADNIPFKVEADVVVVASGGIGGSIEKVRTNWYQAWGKPPEIILNGNNAYNHGDLHDVAAAKVNANVINLDKMWLYAAGVHHPQPKFPGHGLSLVPPKSALWVNYKGERIGPRPLVTAYDTRYLVERICAQEKKYSWQILNYKIAVKELAISGAEHNPAIRDKKILGFLKAALLGNKTLVDDMIKDCPDFVVANSLEELVEKMNKLEGNNDVDINTVKKVISNYDAAIGRGPDFEADEQLKFIKKAREYRGDKARTCNFQKINDTKAFPLIAIREYILSRKTLGGIETDLECRVLSKPFNGKQESINGLFAVGEAAGFGGGGMHGLRTLEGTFLGGCVLTGRVAAHAIAGKKLV